MKFLIKLKPLEPYFFGTDRSFSYGDTKIQLEGNYFIESSNIPNQTTLLGLVRYLGIREVKNNFYLSEEDKMNIGEESFDFSKEKQCFGKIHKISPLYLIDKNDELYIRTPFDHRVGSMEYNPYKEYEDIQTNIGDKKIPVNYNVKNGITFSYMNVSSKKIVNFDELFEEKVRVGICIVSKEEAYFKKKYKMLNPDYAFAFFVEADDDFFIKESLVFLGQGKSTFQVQIIHDIKEPDISILLRKDIVYVQGDLLLEKASDSVIETCEFSMIETKDYRGYITNYQANTHKARFKKSNIKYRLITAGSIFKISDVAQIENKLKNEKLEAIGLNIIVKGEKNED